MRIVNEKRNLMYISYRSYLRSCNYRCPYCPFGKFRETKEQVEKDKKALERFYWFLKKQAGILHLFFTPYGEILGKEYYWEYFANVSKMSTVMEIGCQTNASFSVEKMLAAFDRQQGDREKLRLWCTYHPDMVSEDRFLSVCRELEREKIPYSVGLVVQNGKIEQVCSLREQLSAAVYLWCNAIEGIQPQYTQEELNLLKIKDPYFLNECMHFKADIEKCIGGKNAVFIKANGDYYSCHISKEKMGNIYETPDRTEIKELLKSHTASCRARECSCYLAYRLREDIREKLPQNFFYRL